MDAKILFSEERKKETRDIINIFTNECLNSDGSDINMNKILNTIKVLKPEEEEKIKQNINLETAEILLQQLNGVTSNNKNSLRKERRDPPKENIISNSKKPLWNEEVKKTCMELIPNCSLNEIEQTKDILMQECSSYKDEILIDHEEYPYFMTVKKLLYAFGDCYKNNTRTILFIHDFAKKFLIQLAKIITDCDFKKVLEHLYSYEYAKFYNYKKLKFKNSFNLGGVKQYQEHDDLLKEEGNNENEDFMNHLTTNNNFNLLEEDNLSADSLDREFEINFANNNNENQENPENPENNENNPKRKKNCLENIFEDKDDNYFENLQFQDLRSSAMSEGEYLEYISCRTQHFLTRGKKTFLNFLTNIIPNGLPFEYRDQNYLELISFILKEIIHKNIKTAIKLLNNGKLVILKFPIRVEDISCLFNEELDKMENFFKDFNTSLYMMKEFKKKKLNKGNNKNVKIKKTKNGVFNIVVRKIIFLLDNDQIEFMRKNKKKTEEKLFQVQKNLQQRIQTTNRRRRKVVEENINKTVFDSVDEIIHETKIENYYEYFLTKDLFQRKFDEETGMTKFTINKTILKNISKKYINTKFDQWLKLTNEERLMFINNFNNKMY
jgi:hypothetical protein